jgi:cation diffusion facilitator CzcD-associated flavoprotein CzcO
MRVAVIGAGPSGLVTLKYLKTAHQFFPGKPIEVKLFEAESSVGGTFSHRTYEDAEVSMMPSPSNMNDPANKNRTGIARLIQVPHLVL